MKPAGYYVQRSSGLFPAPFPSNNLKLNEVCQLFELLGIFLAKSIQDGRRVDIPLSDAFLKLMCFRKGNSNIIYHNSKTPTHSHSHDKGIENQGAIFFDNVKTDIKDVSDEEESLWFRGCLTIEDLCRIDSHRGQFLVALRDFVKHMNAIMFDSSLSEKEQKEATNSLVFENGSQLKDLM